MSHEFYQKSVIEDFSVEGKRRWLKEHKWDAIQMLAEALESFCRGERLDSNRLAKELGEESLIDFAQICVTRLFIDKVERDRWKLADRSLKMFNKARYWIKLKVSNRAYTQVISRSRIQSSQIPVSELSMRPISSEDSSTQRRIDTVLGETLSQLNDASCPTMVTYWLASVKKLREARWLNLDQLGKKSGSSGDKDLEKSRGRESQYRQLALWRYLCLLKRFIQFDCTEEISFQKKAIRLTYFQKCSDSSPYRNKPKEIKKLDPRIFNDCGAHHFSHSVKIEAVELLKGILAEVKRQPELDRDERSSDKHLREYLGSRLGLCLTPTVRAALSLDKDEKVATESANLFADRKRQS